MTESSNPDRIQALKVRQWMTDWDNLPFNPVQLQSKPKEHFYLFSMSATKLRALAGIYRRSTDDSLPRAEDLGIQRRHDPVRSEEIRRYVKGGYPWSALSAAKRENPDNDKLRKPGWLPTAVVINILEVGDQREGRRLEVDEAISVLDVANEGVAHLTLPQVASNPQMPPLEVIDGQHRLFAFEEGDASGDDYQLPVVAFVGLDISWQAYLFWTINIKPKKINPSLAFDLYPLLREQEWLEEGDVLHVYKESRAQELTEMLWSTPSSPWYRRINMLGGSRKENGPVTQAAFIKTLLASMVKSWKSSRTPIGGLFGGAQYTEEGLSWSRLQQGAFLVGAWKLMAEAIANSQAEWAESIRNAVEAHDLDDSANRNSLLDKALTSQYSLLATDQGVRAFLNTVNDVCYLRNQDLKLEKWREPLDGGAVTPDAVEQTLASLSGEPVFGFLQTLAGELATFDWRASSFPGLSEDERQRKSAYRGSGGYKELRMQLLRHLADSRVEEVATAAREIGEQVD